MLARLRDVLTRHRRKFIITGLIVGGTYIALKYAKKKLIELQDRQTRELMEKARRMQHFDSTEKTCNQIIIGMATEMIPVILRECNTTELLAQLKENPSNKMELWEELKIVTFTRFTAFIYASSLLVVALRIQLNILGGYIYCDNVNSLLKGQKPAKPQKINEDIKQKYLSLLRHFVEHGGVLELVRVIKTKVAAALKSVPLTKCFTLADMEQLFWSLQMCINSDSNTDPCSKMSKYLLPTQLGDYAQGDPVLKKMIYDTLDLFESDDASGVCAHNVNRGFSLAVDAIAEKITETVIVPLKQAADNTKKDSPTKQPSDNDDSNTPAIDDDNLLNINTIQLALAKLIPIISGMTARNIDCSGRTQNLATSLITFYVISEKSKVLGANVYETFSALP